MKKIGFVGFGLIGGSLAKIWHKKHPEYSIIVYDHHKEITPDYQAALEDGVVKEITNDLRDFSDCNLIVLCTPVMTIVSYLAQLKDIVCQEAIITDVGSVKGRITSAAFSMGLESIFIGGHPMAGSEKTGYLNANPNLFENSYYILTPFDETPSKKLEELKHFIEETKAVTIVMDSERHDEVTAAISHVPHVVASALVNSVAQMDDNMMELLAAGGFRDITRIASSSPSMWRDICLSNKRSIELFLERFIQTLIQFKRKVSEEDGKDLFHYFAEGKEYRDSLPLKKSNMAISHEILLYVPDEPGEIAIIASILASKGISIKNIGIAHNREFSEGVLRVEFYDHSSLKSAYKAIQERNYKIFN